MNKKTFIIVAIFIILIILIIFSIKINKTKNKSVVESNSQNFIKQEIQKDNETGEYYIYDSNNEIHRAEDESELLFYQYDPSYNPMFSSFDS